ncbi:flippase-like domain-containing protein [Spirobacillus cienkowskii]|uniref:flippase-like domain-containing protein n=1 Tax=Spirobacillus cienkowskii TaxID=495820 RepID=UPI0030D5B6E0
MRTLFKIFILLILSVLTIYFMYSQEIINFSSLRQSFYDNKKIIVFIAFIQILNILFLTLRYFSLLKIFQIHAAFKNVLASNYVSLAIGQWFPGALAVIEVLRIALMLGSHNKAANINESNKIIDGIEQALTDLSLKSKLAAVSLMDRLIGFIVMLFIGCITILFLYFKSVYQNPGNLNNLLLFLLFNFSLFVLMLTLPFLAKSKFFRKIITRIETLCIVTFRKGILNKIFRKFFNELNSLFDVLTLGIKKVTLFWVPLILSFVSFMLMGLGLYLSGVAISASIPFSAILSVISILSLASLLPIGLGGMGGMQIVAILVFSIFNVSPQHASSAQLLQTAISLIAITFMGLLFAKFSSAQICKVLSLQKNKEILTRKI